MNIVILIGRLAKDPELSYTPNTQTAVCRFPLAVDRPRREGKDQGADFIRITVFGRQAENCDKYIAKGRQIALMGRIQTGSYKNKDGQTVYTTDVIADRVEFIGSKGDNRASDGRNESEGVNPQPQQNLMSESEWDIPDSFSEAEDDIPF